MDPLKRLGTGSNDTPLGYNALKAHEFFKGITFDGLLHKSSPPIDPVLVSKHQLERQNAAAANADPDADSDSPDEKAEVILEKVEVSKQQKVDKIVKEGIIAMKSGWFFYNDNKFVLSTQPRFSYYDPSSGKYKVLKCYKLLFRRETFF